MNNDKTNIDSRYSRQTLFKPIGREGQQKLNIAKVAIVGMGALGTVLANHMVRAGVGYLRVIDRDFVEWSNLQRQMLYDENDAREHTPKAIAASKKLQAINSAITIEPHVTDLNPLNAENLLTDVDLILDGTDNFSIRFLINDISIKHRIPWIYGGAVSSRGVTMTIIPGQTPCLRCMFEHAPAQGTTETCDTAGVIGPIIHLVASYQATEAIKYLTENIEALHHKMIHMDIWANQFSSIHVSQATKSDCPCCAKQQFDYLNIRIESETIQTLCGRNSIQILPIQQTALNLQEWTDKLKPLGPVEANRFLLKFNYNDDITIVLFSDGRVLVQGTDDPIIAKNLYSRFIGM